MSSTSTLDNILSNPGLIHIRQQIFGYFDHKTLEVCSEVLAQRFGEDWDAWLERLASIQYMVEFGDKLVNCGSGTTVKDFIPGWYKGVKKFSNMASLKDLNEIKGSMKGFLNLHDELCHPVRLIDKYGPVKLCHPVHLIAKNGHVKLMELLFHTDYDLNQSGFTCLFDGYYYNPFIIACKEGRTDNVNLLINSTKEFGIDLNARDENAWTVFMLACKEGSTEIVQLMVNSSKEFDIDLLMPEIGLMEKLVLRLLAKEATEKL